MALRLIQLKLPPHLVGSRKSKKNNHQGDRYTRCAADGAHRDTDHPLQNQRSMIRGLLASSVSDHWHRSRGVFC